MKNKNKWNRIPLDIYETYIDFCFVNDNKDFESTLKKHSEDSDMEGSYAAFFYDKKDEKRIVFNSKHLHPKIIAHESFHATHYVMEEIGEDFDINSHESFAWLNEYIFNSIHKHYLIHTQN
jgi:hypothetical protein|tara:strand:+ start:9871 stop:10233 length:363 start_codon:yes stop_codon:yes gene_type:complete